MIPLGLELAREAPPPRILQQLRHDDLADLPRQVVARVDGPERQVDGADGQVERAARRRSVPEEAVGELDEGLLEEGFQGRGDGGRGEEGGEGADGDDPAVGEGDVCAGGDVVQDWGAGVEAGRVRGWDGGGNV